MQNLQSILLQSVFSLNFHADLNHLGCIQAKEKFGQAGVGIQIIP